MKVVVYALCKDEEKNVELWYESMKEADEIYVLDTGSTDSTIEKLRELPKVHVEQKKYENFRFDIARNDSLDLIPYEDCICVCTDFDERFNIGWRKELESSWNLLKNINCAKYKYVDSDSTQDADSIKWGNRIHSRKNFLWKRAINEYLMCTEEKQEIKIKQITLYHFQDKEKKRDFYIDLYKKQIEENPNDFDTLFLLGREYMKKEMYSEAIDLYHQYLKNIKDIRWEDKMNLFVCLGKCYSMKEYIEESILWYKKAEKEGPNIREIYYYLGLQFYKIGNFINANKYFMQSLFTLKKQRVDIIEVEPWDGSIYWYLTYCNLNLNNYKSAAIYAKEALKYFENNKGLLDVIDTCNQKMND